MAFEQSWLLCKVIIFIPCDKKDHFMNRPRSIYMYQYSNMALRLSGQTSIFGVVFFVSKSLLGIENLQ